MDVALITMEEEEAREKLDEYRAGLALRDDAEYERLVKAYAALAHGTPLLVLSQVIARAPRDDRGRPRLAIGRADRRQVHYRRERNRPFETFDTFNSWRRPPSPAWGTELAVPVVPEVTPEFPPPIDRQRPWLDAVREGYALVPMVPPDVRGRRALNKHFVLWEVERWANQRIGAAPDRDPYLLQLIGDDLYAVVGEWDLTDVERAIMSDRARG